MVGQVDLQQIGRLIILGALVLALLGGVLWTFGRLGVGGKVGSLPGDIRFGGEGWSCFVPITTSILLSLLLTAILTVLARFFR